MSTPVQLRISDPADIAEIVPIMLGFHPRHSLVALYVGTEGTEACRAVRMAARIDIPAEEELEELTRLVTQHIQPLDRIILVAYASDHLVAASVLNHFKHQIPLHQIQDLIAVTADEIWQVDHQGQAQELSAPQGRVSAEAVLAGIPIPAGDRDSLRSSVQVSQTPQQAREASTTILTMIKEDLVLGVAEMTDRMAELNAGGWPKMSDHDLLQLVASVQSIGVRDAAWAAMTCATASSHADLWRQAATLVDGPQALPVLALLGMAGWISGNGALSNVALDRASTIDGHENYSLFGLVKDILSRAVHPNMWTALRPNFLADEMSD